MAPRMITVPRLTMTFLLFVVIVYRLLRTVLPVLGAVMLASLPASFFVGLGGSAAACCVHMERHSKEFFFFPSSHYCFFWH
jgi:hypothetical protein